MGETEETDVEPTPETEEEPEENFTRSGGRRASNLNRERNREVASKEIPQGNVLAENKDLYEAKGGFITVGNKKYGINSALTMINNIYDILYDSEKELDNIFPFGIGIYTDEGDKLIKEKDPQVIKLINARGDAFTSDREATALGMFFSGLTKEALTSMLISNASKTENKEIKTEKKIVIDNMGETYTIDTDAKTYTVKTAKGEKTFTFDEMNDFVKQARGANRIYKPMSLLAYTDYKNGSLKNWGIKEEAVNTTKVNNSANVVCTLNLKGEPQEVSGGLDKVDINIKGVNELTDMIKTAITQRFAGIFKSDWNGDIYTQDIRVAEDLWLTFLDYDENSNTLNFVLDGDIAEDPALTEAKKIDDYGVDVFCKDDTDGVIKSVKRFSIRDLGEEEANKKADELVNKLNQDGKQDVAKNEYGRAPYVPAEKDEYIKAYEERFGKKVRSFEWEADVLGTALVKINGKLYKFDIDTKQLEEANRVTEAVSEKEYDDIVSAIDNATSIEELQDIVLAVSDGTVEDEMQSMLDACIKDNDDLDTVKSLLSNIFEDNADIEE